MDSNTIKLEMENKELKIEIIKLGQLLKGYESLMAYWKRRCYESDEYINYIFELFDIRQNGNNDIKKVTIEEYEKRKVK